MYTANEILSKVNEYINNLTYDRNHKSLYEPIKIRPLMGGKRIRPYADAAFLQSFLRTTRRRFSHRLAPLRPIINYTLLHDDLMDDAPLRRGQQTVHVRWDANTAILSGDSMLVLALRRWLSATADTSARCFVSLPLRHLRLERVSSTTWS